MKKLPTWALGLIIFTCFWIGYKFGYAIVDWILNLLNI